MKASVAIEIHHRPSQLRTAASALYLDRAALWTAAARRLSNLAMAWDGEIFRIANGPFAGYLIDPADVRVISRSAS